MRDLPDLLVGYLDGLVLGVLSDPLNSASGGQIMVRYDVMDVQADVMVGASVGMAQLSRVGLVMVHRRFTPLVRSRVAWAVGLRLRRERLAAGGDPRVVVTGARPSADLVPDGVEFTAHPVRLREGDTVSPIEVWEVVFPDLVAARELARL